MKKCILLFILIPLFSGVLKAQTDTTKLPIDSIGAFMTTGTGLLGIGTISDMGSYSFARLEPATSAVISIEAANKNGNYIIHFSKNKLFWINNTTAIYKPKYHKRKIKR